MGAERRWIIGPDEGDRVKLSSGVGVIYKVEGAETGGVFAILEHPVDVGAFVPPHAHEREDELSYVLEGRIGVLVGDREFIVGAGSYVFKPRALPHAFWNVGDEPARLIELVWPPTMTPAFREMAALEGTEAGRGLMEKYGIRFRPELLPGLVARHGLRLPRAMENFYAGVDRPASRPETARS